MLSRAALKADGVNLPSNCSANANLYVTCNFDYTGSDQYYTVPSGITSMFANVVGAQGGSGDGPGSSPGGESGYQDATISVQSGEQLTLLVGGQGAGSQGGGAGGWPDGGSGASGTVQSAGCGGGGSSQLYDDNGDLLLVDAGGGGCGGTEGSSLVGGNGGNGGNDPTGAGPGGSTNFFGCNAAGGGGQPGSSTNDGGAGGNEGYYYNGGSISCDEGNQPGSFGGQGGYSYGGAGGVGNNGAGSGGGGGGGWPGGGGGGGGNEVSLANGGGGGGGGGLNYADTTLVTGAYAGTATHTGDGIIQLSYQMGSSGTTLSSTLSSGGVDESDTLTADVDASSGDPDGGTVSFSETPSGGKQTTICSAAVVASSAASCDFTPTVAGTYSLSATYSGNGGVAGSTSSTVQYPVTVNTSETSVNYSLGPAGSLLVTATVNGAPWDTPVGSVSFSALQQDGSDVDSPVALCTGVATTNADASRATASCTVTAAQLLDEFAPGVPYYFVATFASSDPGTSGSTSTGRPVYDTANASTSVTVTGPPASPTYGAPVTADATVTATPSTTIDGQVTFTDTAGGSSRVVCNDVTLTDGVFPCTFTPPATGTNQLSAMYLGGKTTNPSQSTTGEDFVFDVGLRTPPLTLTANQSSPAAAGQAIELTATLGAVSGGNPPGGSVTFTAVEGQTSTTICSESLSGSRAECRWTPTAGSYQVSAAYGGDSNDAATTGYLGGQGAAYVVDAGSSTVTLAPVTPSSLASPVPAGTAVTIAASVTSTDTAVAPTGTVVFDDDGQPIASCGGSTGLPVTASPVDCTWTPTAGGPAHTVTASYSGDANNAPSSTTTPLSVQVSAEQSSTALTFSPQTPVYGQPLALTATVTVGGTAVGAGSVDFQEDGSDIATCTAVAVTAAGTATCDVTPSAGPHSFVANFFDGGSAGDSSSAATPVTVGADPTTTSVAAAVTPAGTALTATVTASTAGGAAPGVPTGTVTITVDGTAPPGCSDLSLPAGSGTTAVVSCDWTSTPGPHALEADYTPADGSFVESSGTENYTPPAVCSTGYASIYDAVVANGSISLTNSAIGASLTATATASGPCDPTTAIPFTVSGSLFDGSLTTVGVAGDISQDGGICFTSGALSLPSAWDIANPTITVPVCFAITDSGGFGAPTSGTLTSGSSAIALPFVDLPEIPSTTLTVSFAPSAVTVDFEAGSPTSSSASADLAVTIDGTGAYTGTLTTTNLSLFGQPLDLSGTVSGGGGAVPTVTASASLGTVDLVTGLTLDGVVVTATNAGLAITASATLGGNVPLSVTVSGTISAENTWSLDLAATTTTWTPVSGLAVNASFAGSVSDAAGVYSYSLSAGTPGQEAVSWSPGAGITLTLTTITLASSTTGCDGGSVAGSGDPLLTLSGSVAIASNGAAIAGCVDLATGAFQLGATADSAITVASGFSVADLALTLSGGGGQGATLTGTATGTVTAGGKVVTVPTALEVTSSGALTVVGSLDLTPLGIPVSGYVAYSSAPVTGFLVDPATDATVDLPAGVSAQGTYTPGATVTALLQQAGFTLPAGGAITFMAALSPSTGITFDGQLSGPGSLPFLTLPGGGALQSASLSWSAGVLQISADATFPVPGASAPATATITVSINTSTGAFSGTGTVDGLQLFGQPVSLSGSITGTPDASTGKDTIAAAITGTIAGPFSPPDLPLLDISGLSVTLGTAGVSVAGTLSAANLGSLSLTGSLSSLSDWTITVAGSAKGWHPDPSISIGGTVSGTLTDTSGALTYDIAATPSKGATNVASFTPSSGVTLGVASVELSNGSDLPTGCSVAMPGDTWLDVDGDLSASFSGQDLEATASGCFDLTAKSFELSAGLTGSISALNGAVTVDSPTVTITEGAGGFTVAGMASLTVDMPVGGTFEATLDLAYEGSGKFVVGSEVNLSQYLGDIGAVGYLYYSSAAVNGFQTGDPTLGAINLAQGVSFALDVSLPASEDQTLTHLGVTTPSGSIGAVGTINFASDVFTLRLQYNAGLAGQALFTTASGVTLKLDSGFLQLSVGGDQVSFSIGLNAELDLPAVDPGDAGSVVPLTGLLTFSPEEIDASLSVGTCNDPADAWKNAFGITGLSVECATVQGGLSLEGIPFPSFGFSGQINGLPTNLSNAIGYVNDAPITFAFNLDPLLLSLSIGTQGSTIPALEPFAAFGQGSLAEVFYASVYVSPTGATVGSTVYPAGFGLAFDANLDGVSINILAQLDLATPSLTFDASVSQIVIGALTVGPVTVDLQASPSSFSFMLDASIQLGPGTAQIGPALSIGGELSGSISVSLGSSGLSAYITASAQVTLGAYIAQETCYDDDFPVPCDYQWEYTSFGFNLAQTGFSVTASGLTLTYNGSSIFLPWPSPAAPERAAPAGHGAPTVIHLGPAAAATGTGTGASASTGTPGSWAAAAALPVGTGQAATATLRGGSLLVAGGAGSAGPIKSAEVYSPTTGAWTTVSDLHQARAGATATLLPNGTVLVAGGRGSSNSLASAEIFHPNSGKWTTTGPMVAPTTSGTASLLPDGMVLVAGGRADGEPTAVAQLFDPATGTWTATGSMATARTQQTATVLPDGTVLVAGGLGTGGPLSSAEVYDPATGSWSPTAPMHFARAGASAVLLKDGTVLVTGDATNAEIYDPASGTWTITAPEPEARTDASAALLPDGRVLVVGGIVAAGPKHPALAVDTAEIYDPATELWGAVAPLPFAVAGASAGVLPGGEVVVAGGLSAPGAVSTAAAVFTPAPPAPLPWPAAVSGPASVAPGSTSGFYIGEQGDSWRLNVTQPKKMKARMYTGTITLDRGSFADVSGTLLEPVDHFTVDEGTITFQFRNTGGLDGLTFVTPRSGTVITFSLAVDGVQATTSQVYEGAGRTAPEVANPVTVIRQGAAVPTGAT